MRNYDKKSEVEQKMYDAMVDELSTMVRPDWIDVPIKMFSNPKNRLMILKGIAGTGKDIGADFIIKELGAVGIHQQWDAGIERQDVTATTGINTDPKEDDVSPYRVIQGILNRCAERGWVAVIDEANMALPGVTTLLNGFTDGSRYFVEYERLVPIHPNFFIILTMNPGYRGTYPFNPSTLTRAALTIDVGAPGVDTEYEWLKASTNDYEGVHKYEPNKLPKKAWSLIYRVSQMFFDYAAKNTDNVDVTYRQRRRIVDVILFDPFDVDNIKYAFTNVLFNSMGVNEDDAGKAKSFADTPSMYEQYKAIATILKRDFDPTDAEMKAHDAEVAKAKKEAEPHTAPSKRSASMSIDDIDSEVEELIGKITTDVKSYILDKS